MIPKPLQKMLEQAAQQPEVKDIEALRELTEWSVTQFNWPKVALPKVEDRSIQKSDGLNIPVRIYHPAPTLSLPVMFYFHGGVHVVGSIDTHDALCRRIASQSDCIVVSVGYRLAPESPYPNGLNDCAYVFQQRNNLLQDFHCQPDQVFLAGDSAGGALAVTVAHQALASDKQCLAGLILLYPSLDYTLQHDSIERFAEGYLLTKDKIEWYFDQYFANGGDRVEASPLYFDDLSGLVPIYLAVAEYDPLHDEATEFAHKAHGQNVVVELEIFKGMVHIFAQLDELVPRQFQRLLNHIQLFVHNRVNSQYDAFK